MSDVAARQNIASLLLKHHIRTKIDLIVPNIKNFVQDKQNARSFNSKVKSIKFNQEKAARNYTLEVKLKMVRIIAKQNKLYYKIQVGLNCWKRHVDKITNIKQKVCFDNNTNFEERYTEKYGIENTVVKKCESQLIYSSIPDLQSADSHLIHPDAQSSKPANSDLILLIPKITAQSLTNDDSSDAPESIKSNSSSCSPTSTYRQ